MKNKPWIWILIIAIFGTGLYLQSLGFEYSLDDGIYTNFNRVTSKGMESWTELFQYGSMNFIEINPTNSGVYRPFSLLTFALEREVVGAFDPAISHGINLILYFAVLLIIGFLLDDLLGKKKLAWWVPALILLVYAVHPVHVEVVASVKSRDTLLSAFFGFSAILIWLKSQPSHKKWQWALVLVLFFLSLISKEESLPLLALVGLISYFFLGKKPLDSVKSVLPFLGTAGLYLIIRLIVLDPSDPIYNTYVNSVLYSAKDSERLATNLYIYLQYLRLLLFPHPLSWDYSFSQFVVQTFSSPWVWLSFGTFAALVWIMVKGFKSRNPISFGLIFYFASFSIFANLTSSLTIGSNMAERFLFVPSLGFAFLLVFGIYLLTEKYFQGKAMLLTLILIFPIVLGFSWKTFGRAHFWKSNYTILKEDIKNAPNSWRTHTLYAEELRKIGLELRVNQPDSSRKLLEEARREYEIMLGILGPNMPVPQYLSAYSEVLIALGDTTQAVASLNEAIKKNPQAFYPLFQLGRFSFESGDFEQAEKYYLQALKAQRPNFGPVYKNLGLTYFQKGEKEKAAQAWEKSLEYWDGADIRRSLAYLYAELGQVDKASEFLSESDQGSQEERDFLSAILSGNEAMGREDYAKAVSVFSKAEQLFEEADGKNKFPSFFAVYGKALLETGDTTNSKRNFLLAISEMDTRDPVVYTNLGTIAFSKEKNFAEAERYYSKALELGAVDKFNAYSNVGMAQLAQRKEREAGETFEKALEYGNSRSVIINLYLINRSLGNQEKAARYQKILSGTN